jgi:hypothetical protein
MSAPVALRRPFNGSGALSKLLQYWFFYRYDRWDQPVLAGRLIQQHQGDWEVVSIGVSDADVPLFVAYSAHCGGIVEPWRHGVQLAKSNGMRTEHPLVATAEGSQANYPRADQHRAPDIVGCQGGPRSTARVLAFASHIRDETAYGWLWYPAELIPVNDTTPPMSYPGTWGEDDRTEWRVGETRTLDSRSGPLTPRLQAVWYDPVKAIFCGHYDNGTCPAR